MTTTTTPDEHRHTWQSGTGLVLHKSCTTCPEQVWALPPDGTEVAAVLVEDLPRALRTTRTSARLRWRDVAEAAEVASATVQRAEQGASVPPHAVAALLRWVEAQQRATRAADLRARLGPPATA